MASGQGVARVFVGIALFFRAPSSDALHIDGVISVPPGQPAEGATLGMDNTVMVAQLGDERLRAELEALAMQMAGSRPTRVISNRGGWQSDKSLHKDALPPIEELLTLVEQPAASLLKLPAYSRRTRLEAGKEASGVPASFSVSEAWINVNGPGASNVWHNHLRNSKKEVAISGVYYASVGNSGPARLKMRQGEKIFDVEPKPGQVVLFPAAMEHSVEPHANVTGAVEAPRISVAFNLHPRWFTSRFFRAAWDGDVAQLQGFDESPADNDEKVATALLHEAAEAGHAAAVEFLLEHRADPDGSSKSTQNPLCQVVRARRDPIKAVSALLGARADVFQTVPGGWQPIHSAALRNDSALMDLLLASGAPPRARSHSGMEPLHIAAASGHINVVRRLLARGADLRAKDLKGQMAIHAAAGDGRNDVVRLLAGLDTDSLWEPAKNGDLPVHIAADSGYLAVVETLGSHPGMVQSIGRDGQGLVHAAVRRQHSDVLTWLIGHGADPHSPDSKGQPPVHLAAAKGHSKMIARLVAAGASLCTKDSSGATVHDLAAGTALLDEVDCQGNATGGAPPCVKAAQEPLIV